MHFRSLIDSSNVHRSRTTQNRRILDEPASFFEQHAEPLVILDEVHQVPEIFSVIRGTIDRARRQGKYTGMFLFLGSASMDLLRQSSESLAGRIAIVELDPINILDAHKAGIEQVPLWMRGGFPLSLTAASMQDSFDWRSDFIRTYLERDIPSFAKGANVSLLDNLWTMLSYAQGSLLNVSSLSRSLGVSSPTVQNYVDLLEKMLLVRLVRPFHANIKKRYVKSPKVFVRDSGLTHAQLGLVPDLQILRHPVVGHSWEGFAIENILSVVPTKTRFGFFRTSKGAEIDLVLQFPGLQSLWALEIKRSIAASVRKGFYIARDDVSATRSYLVHPGNERYMLKHDVEAIGLLELCEQISAESQPES